MKKIFFYIAITCIYVVAKAQIPNGDFENLNHDGTLSNWGNVYLFSVVIDTTGGSLIDSIEFDNGYFYKPTNDAHSGNTAMLLSNCYNHTNNQILIGSASSDQDSVFSAWGSLELVPLQIRPDNFSFYYKFLSVNNDTALAKLILYDSLANPIGEAKKIIIGTQNTYILTDIPVSYYTPDSNIVVAYYSLNFSTFYSEEPTGVRQGSRGTRLWIDDVSLNKTISIQAISNNSLIQVYPNPAKNVFLIDTKESIKTISLTDLSGKNISVDFKNLNHIDCSAVSNGLYYLTIETDKGVFSRKLIIE